jgi:ornithine carbamoyltransferase
VERGGGKLKDFISVLQIDRFFLENVIHLARYLKDQQKSGEREMFLEGKSVALLFEKPSTRTRVSFEVGVHQLGGQPIYIDARTTQIARGEPLKDVARVLSRYVDMIVVRTYAQKNLEELALYSEVPVINALTNEEHPCQAVSDIFTVWEYKRNLKNLTLAYVGDGNNVCNSLIVVASMMGMNVRVGVPKGYEPDQKYVEFAKKLAEEQNSEFLVTNDPEEAVSQADIVYTDVWTSMGDEGEEEERRKIFKDYQVNKKLLSLAKEDVLFMHCLPAHRGEEVTEEVLEGERSIVWEQAENKLHVQKAIMLKLLRLKRGAYGAL